MPFLSPNQQCQSTEGKGDDMLLKQENDKQAQAAQSYSPNFYLQQQKHDNVLGSSKKKQCQ